MQTGTTVHVITIVYVCHISAGHDIVFGAVVPWRCSGGAIAKHILMCTVQYDTKCVRMYGTYIFEVP